MWKIVSYFRSSYKMESTLCAITGDRHQYSQHDIKSQNPYKKRNRRRHLMNGIPTRHHAISTARKNHHHV